MHADALIIQRPDGPAPQLILLFHGVGADPQSMQPLAKRMAAEWPQAFVVCVRAPHATDSGYGWQWFSLWEIDDANREARIAAAMPEFIACIEHWQRESGATPDVTALVGFSQGAIMALASTATPRLLAGRIVALAGRYADRPYLPLPQTTLHFIHGKDDPIIHYRHTVSAAETLVAAGADLTADVLPRLGHFIDDRVQDLVIERLRTHIPAHRWQEAMQAARAIESDETD